MSKFTDTLAAHSFNGPNAGRTCACGWQWLEKRTYACGEGQRVTTAHAAHVEAMLTEAGCAVVELPEPYPDDTVHPYWAVNDINGPQVVAVTDSDGSVPDENWVSIQFTARNRTVDTQTAIALGAALLAAAAAAARAVPATTKGTPT
jgi:hypothetical protein